MTGKKIALLCMLWDLLEMTGSAEPCWSQDPAGHRTAGHFCFHLHSSACQRHLGNPSRSLLQPALTTTLLSVHALLLSGAGTESVHLRSWIGVLIHLFWERAELAYILAFGPALLLPHAVASNCSILRTSASHSLEVTGVFWDHSQE